jgi:hypothetical protein
MQKFGLSLFWASELDKEWYKWYRKHNEYELIVISVDLEPNAIPTIPAVEMHHMKGLIPKQGKFIKCTTNQNF